MPDLQGGRKKNVTGQGKDVYKRGDGLGTGPVGTGGAGPKPPVSGGSGRVPSFFFGTERYEKLGRSAEDHHHCCGSAARRRRRSVRIAWRRFGKRNRYRNRYRNIFVFGFIGIDAQLACRQPYLIGLWFEHHAERGQCEQRLGCIKQHR